MTRFHKALVVTAALIAGLWCATVCCNPVAHAQVSRPHPSATPQVDPARKGMGVPRPSAAPTCGNLDEFFYGDLQGCIYACTDGRTTIVAGVTCVLPTAAATVATTATPTLTASATPTPTVTSTP